MSETFHPLEEAGNGAVGVMPEQQPESASAWQENQPFAPQAAPAEKAGGTGGKTARFFGKMPRKVLIPCAIVVALVLIFVFAGNAILVKLAPSAALGSASAKTGKLMTQRLEDSPYQMFAVLGKLLTDGGRLDCSVDYYDDWSSMQLDFDLAGSVKNRQFAGGFDVEYDGVPLDARLYFDGDQAAAASSYLDNVWYGAKYKNFESDLKASALPKFADISEEDMQALIDAVGRWEELLHQDQKASYEPYADVIKEFSDGLKFESSSERAEVGGEKVDVTAVSTEISAKKVRNLLLDLYDAAVGSEAAREAYVTGQLANQPTANRKALEREFDEEAKAARERLRSELDQLSGELELHYYLLGNKLVKMEADGTIGVSGETMTVQYGADFGCDPAKDDWTASCTLQAGGESIVLQLTYSSEETKKAYEDSLVLSFSNGWDKMSFSIDNDWSRESGKLETVMGYDEGRGRESLRLVSKLTTGNDRFTLKLREVNGTVLRGEDGNAFSLSAEVGGKIAKPSFVNLDKWDDAVMETFQTAKENFHKAQYGDTNSYSVESDDEPKNAPAKEPGDFSAAPSAAPAGVEAPSPSGQLTKQEYQDAVEELSQALSTIQEDAAAIDADDEAAARDLLDKMKTPFADFMTIVPPEEYEKGDEKMKTGCQAMIDYIDAVISMLDASDTEKVQQATEHMMESLQTATVDFTEGAAMLAEADS